MPHVNLKYENETLTPDPEPVKVRPGDTLTFALVSPVNGDVTVTMDEPDLFSKASFKKGEDPIQVVTPKSTTYSCEVTVNGQVVVKVDGKTHGSKSGGGSIEPDTGDGN